MYACLVMEKGELSEVNMLPILYSFHDMTNDQRTPPTRRGKKGARSLKSAPFPFFKGRVLYLV